MFLRSRLTLATVTVVLAGLFTVTSILPAGDALAKSKHSRRHDERRRERRHERHEERHSRVVITRPVIHPGRIVERLPRGHREVRFRGRRYFYNRGAFYRRRGPGFIVVAPPVGTVVASLGVKFSSIWIGGLLYYYYGDIFYRRVPRGYVVVEPPQRVIALYNPPTLVQPQEAAAGNVTVTVYRLNVRLGPGYNYPILHQVVANDPLIVQGRAPGWLYVRIPNGRFGWVMEQYTTGLLPPASG